MNRIMHYCLCAIIVFAFLLPGSHFGTSQGQAPSGPTESSFQGLTFRNIGPATMGGRVDDLAMMESRPSVFYVATATGVTRISVRKIFGYVSHDDEARHTNNHKVPTVTAFIV